MNPLRRNPLLYEVSTWAWLDELSRRAGRPITLAGVPASEWDNFAQMGFDIVWLMGVWERSPDSRAQFEGDQGSFDNFRRVLPGATMSDVVGSPYSIHAYVPDPHLGGWQALDAARAELNNRGIRLLLDFVPNHVALDHAWTREHPEYFIQGSGDDLKRDPTAFFKVQTPGGAKILARGKDPYFPPWRDVAQLNLFHPGLRAALLRELVEIRRHCDGVRCDMAMLVLNDIFGRQWAGRLGSAPVPAKEIWEEIRAVLPGEILLAEAYWGTEARLISLGFDFVYDKDFYDDLRDEKAGEIRARLAADFGVQTHLARFIENHDEDRAAAVFGPERLRAAATIVGTAPGLRFYHQGQLEGRRVRLPIQLSHIADEPVDQGVYDFYRALLRFTQDDAFHGGAFRPLNPESSGDASFDGLIAYDWQNQNAWKLVVVNLSNGTADGRIRLGDRIAEGRQYIFADVLNNQRYIRDGNELRNDGLYVRLAPFEADIFNITPA